MDWSIQDIGALGEFLGSVAVLLTLVYLAVQTRASRQATDLQTFLALSNNGSSVFATLLASNPEALEIFWKGNAGEPLDERELRIFATIVDGVTVNPYASLLHASPSPTRASALDGYQGLIQSLWENPNFLKLWEAGYWSYLPEHQRAGIESNRATN